MGFTMKKEMLCYSCRFSEIKIVDSYKVNYGYPVHSKVLTIFCKFKWQNKIKFITECSDFSPKSGQIGKKIFQKEITDAY